MKDSSPFGTLSPNKLTLPSINAVVMVFPHNNRKVSNTGGMLTTMQVYNDIDLLSMETLGWCMCRKMLVCSGDRVAIVSTMFNHRGQLDHLIYPVSNLLTWIPFSPTS